MKETELVKKFIGSGEIAGIWEREVPVHPDRLDRSLKYRNYEKYIEVMGKRSAALRIDAVCRGRDKVYLIEAKKNLNPSALGQLLCYKALYKANYPGECENKEIIMMALVLESNPMIEDIFKSNDITVRVWKE